VSMLVDTSVWVDHFRHDDRRLRTLLLREQVQCHPFVIGELACGCLRRRSEVLSLLQSLPAVPVASNNEALEFIERHNLMGRGIGWVDVHLLASASFAGIAVWTRDRHLGGVARLLGLYAQPS
jgi:predicted nucleic acid-binding protein